MPTEGLPVTAPHDPAAQKHVPGPTESTIPEIEVDETIAPRPEEEIADVARATPDVEDHTAETE